MPYNITRSNGDNQSIPDGSIDTSKYSVGVVGRNVLGYGETTANTLVRTLENFANNTAPLLPIPGQLWFDTDTGFMKYNTAASDDVHDWTRLVFADNSGNIGTAVDPWNIIYATQLGSNTDPVSDVYVTAPTDSLHATNKDYVDNTTVAISGDTMTGFLSLHAAPVNSSHAATKQYVDNIAAGMDVKDSCRLATTVNITLSGTQTIDSVSASVGDRVLVKDQSDPIENGIYVVSSGAWTRSTDTDGSPSNEVTSGMFCFITDGSDNGTTGWILNTADPITVGTTPLNFTQSSASLSYIGGDGIDISGNIISLANTIPGDRTFTDRIFIEDGSSAAPAIALSSNNTTGIVGDSSPNSLRMVINGDDKLAIFNSGTSIYNDLLVKHDGLSITQLNVRGGVTDGMGSISAEGTSAMPGSGRIRVGKTTTTGGGLIHRSATAPIISDVAADYLTIYSESNGWTARNADGTDDWEFKGSVTSGNSLYAATGIESAPSIAFSGDTDTGIYSPSVNQVGISCNGDQIARFQVNGLYIENSLFTSDGNNAAPSFSFANDTNTGIYRTLGPGIGFTVGGSTMASFHNSGIVMSSGKTVYASQGLVSTPSISFNGDTNTGIYNRAPGEVSIACNGVLRSYFNASGLTVDGSVTATSYNTTSSLRYKTDVENFDNALSKIKDIDVITYKRKDSDDTKRYLGVSAESLADVVPELVQFKDGEPDSVNYAQGFALAAKAIQEQEQRLEHADFAEYYLADSDYEPGTVLVVGGSDDVTECKTAESIDVFGVVSTSPAFAINSGISNDTNAVQVALLGRVPVKVTGKVKKGQRLVSSNVPGVAKAVDNQTLSELSILSIIGRSLVDKDTDGIAPILAVIGHR